MDGSQPNTKRKARLKDIPGEYGWPILGNTLKILKNPSGEGRRMYETYGLINRNSSFFRKQVSLYGPEANELVLMDRERAFSSELGWAPFLKKLFPRGLMLMDFDHHRAHRKIMGVAFKPTPMKHYIDALNEGVAERVKIWAADGKEFHFYDAMKQLSLDLASTVFMGLSDPDTTLKVNRALTDMVNAAIGVVRYPLPGTLMAKGVKGRKYMVKMLLSEVPKRRGNDGKDMFSQLCNATDDEGNQFTDMEIVDHLNFLWMAAHDTITSSVSTLVYELARHPEWQEKLADEIKSLSLNDDNLPYDKMNDLVLNEYAFKEALRMNPPVPGIPRATVKDVEFGGYVIPKGTIIGINPVFTHRMEEHWPEPFKFDPMRFSAEGGVKERHKYAWIPFSGGAHMCIGLHFAYMQAKVIMAHILPNFRIKVDEGYETEFQILPLIKPVDGLPVRLEPVSK